MECFNRRMYFHAGDQATILFSFWKTDSWQGMFGACLIIFVMALLYEGLKVFREYLLRRSNAQRQYNIVPVSTDDKKMTENNICPRDAILSCAHLTQSLLHILQVVISYFLMLIFMTYNVYLCTAVALGAGVGYFCFGWKRAAVFDANEHCH